MMRMYSRAEPTSPASAVRSWFGERQTRFDCATPVRAEIALIHL